MAFVKFEDIEAWKRGRELVNEIYRITNNKEFYKDYGLKDQMRRAGISVISNIAEGFERRSTTKDFIYFLKISKGSAGEIRAQLYLALDFNYISKDEFEKLKELSNTTGRLISGLIKYLKGC